MKNFSIERAKITSLISALFFFALGFNVLFLYLPLLIIHIVFNIRYFLDIKITKSYFILSCLLFSALFFCFLIGYKNLYNGFKYQTIVVLIISGFYAGYILQKEYLSEQFKLFFYYVFGFWLKALIVVIYSYFTDATLYGYGLLLDPLTGSELNSPAISNSISLCASFFILILIIKPLKKSTQVLLFTCVVFSIAGGIFLGGRTFFIVVLLGVLFALYYKRKFKLLIQISFVLITVLITIFNHDPLREKFNFVLERFDSGLSSSRFDHYLSALQRIPYYPLGGFKVDRSIENTHWFHNLFFDVASVGGWIPLITFIIYFMYVVFAFLLRNKKNSDIKIGFIVFCLCFFILMQDVVLEGNYQLLIVSFFSGLLSLKFNKAKCL
ncbi:O-antigen polymerase [Aeromonas caviae]|uniref:O-antigen polymerase n=1 Tax=Aeromonas caviae TaxID=648 RepID=UPI00114CD8B3|nr:O-antigen polymerase [Aeromonas caviae]